MIVFPMAGLSSRFRKAGYSVDKFMLEAHGRTLFAHAVGGFASLVGKEPFLFIHRDGVAVRDFIDHECARLGFSSEDYAIVALKEPTRGQAETVALGLKLTEANLEEPLTIFNIDSFRPGFHYPDFISDTHVAGYLEVFRGDGNHWSFVRPHAGSNRAEEVAEKRRISDYCSTGLYYFRRAADFMGAFEQECQRLAAEGEQTELYVAPLYNQLIEDGQTVCFHEISPSEVIFCGIPEEYEAFVAAPKVFSLPDMGEV